MSDWSDLDDELDRWAATGRRAALWWRDDDAVAPTRQLERLFDLASRCSAPIGLAVIPATASPALAAACARLDRLVDPLQHGYAHENRAVAGDKKCELGDRRDSQELGDELTRGAARMASLFGSSALPVMVPPWNRIGRQVTARLSELGFAGLSCFGARQGDQPAAGLRQVNTHVDVMRWRPSRGFLGEGAALELLAAELRERREGGRDEPIGLLTHHLVHDEPAWNFLERLLGVLSSHAGARLHRPAQLFRVTDPD